MRGAVLSLAVVLAGLMPAMAPAQGSEQTLADLRQELALLSGQLAGLRRELSTTGGATAPSGGGPLARVDAIEQALQRLTARSEQLENRINSVVNDGMLLIEDQNFRICELDPNCDIANLPEVTPMGGTAPVAPQPTRVAPQDSGVQLARSEQADFERAEAAMNGGDFQGATTLFATFAETYPGGPLTPLALILKGDAHGNMGDTSNAARSYLDAFSGDPSGRYAGNALFKLGDALGRLGQVTEACTTLAEVANRFPGTEDAASAQAARQTYQCG